MVFFGWCSKASVVYGRLDAAPGPSPPPKLSQNEFTNKDPIKALVKHQIRWKTSKIYCGKECLAFASIMTGVQVTQELYG